jgi:hypothetical protein
VALLECGLTRKVDKGEKDKAMHGYFIIMW